MQEEHRNAPQTTKPVCLTSGSTLSAFVIRNDATAAAPTKSHVANASIGLLALAPASNIDETIAFSAFSRARRFHSFNGSVMESSVMRAILYRFVSANNSKTAVAARCNGRWKFAEINPCLISAISATLAGLA